MRRPQVELRKTLDPLATYLNLNWNATGTQRVPEWAMRLIYLLGYGAVACLARFLVVYYEYLKFSEFQVLRSLKI